MISAFDSLTTFRSESWRERDRNSLVAAIAPAVTPLGVFLLFFEALFGQLYGRLPSKGCVNVQTCIPLNGITDLCEAFGSLN